MVFTFPSDQVIGFIEYPFWKPWHHYFLHNYGRRKYEALFVSNVYGTLTMPDEILKGVWMEWTAYVYIMFVCT